MRAPVIIHNRLHAAMLLIEYYGLPVGGGLFLGTFVAGFGLDHTPFYVSRLILSFALLLIGLFRPVHIRYGLARSDPWKYEASHAS